MKSFYFKSSPLSHFLCLLLLLFFLSFSASAQVGVITSLTGVYHGTLTQNKTATSYKFELSLQQNGTAITGLATLDMTNGSGYFINLNINGSLNNGVLTFRDISVSKYFGNYGWCKRLYKARITTEGSIVTLEGTWEDDEDKYFMGTQLWNNADCIPGTFKVSNGKSESTSVVAPSQSTANNRTSVQVDEGVGHFNKTAFDKDVNLIRQRKYSILRKLDGISMLDLQTVTNFRVIETYPNGDPQIIKFDYITGVQVAGEWKSLNTYYAEVFFKNSVPFALFPNRYKPFNYELFPIALYDYDGRDEVESSSPLDFSPQLKSTIKKFYKTFKDSLVTNSPSFIAAMTKLDNYPKEYDVKNCLAIVYKKDLYAYISTIDNPDHNLSFNFDKKISVVDSFGTKDVKYYKNISKHPVIIKGIAKVAGNNGYNYIDYSIKLNPGEITDYFDFTGKWDDDSYYNVQFISDPGTIIKIK